MSPMGLNSIEDKAYDLCVVGGGIYGAWAARDAALRGLKVLLVEKQDWGCATSQSSSKLLHGGLRYLEQFEFGLVRKSLKERDVLAQIVPNLVKPLRFVVPLYKHSRVGPFKMRLGLKIYDQLAGHSLTAKPHKRLSDEEVVENYPWLEMHDFKAALEYSDAQTDDARLTYTIVKAAKALGVDVFAYTEAKLTHTMDSSKVIQLNHLKRHEKVNVKSKSVLLATGPWKDVCIGQKGKARERSRLTKGVHLILPSLQLEHAMTLMAPEDGRVFFIIPWYGRTMVGTTDTDYKGDVENCRVEKEDVDYILNAVNAFIGKDKWTSSDVVGSFCGLRVLQATDEAHPSQASREWALPEIRPAVFRSIGGKLTSAREDAAKAIDHIVECMNFKVEPSESHVVSLYDGIEEDAMSRSQIKDLVGSINLGEPVLDHLLFRYGPNVKKVISIVQKESSLTEKIHEDLDFILAEVDYICQYEEFTCLEDLLRRRMPLMILCPYSENLVNRILTRIKHHLNWTDSFCDLEHAELKRQWQRL